MANDSADVTSSGRSFLVCGPAIGKVLDLGPWLSLRYILWSLVLAWSLGLKSLLTPLAKLYTEH